MKIPRIGFLTSIAMTVISPVQALPLEPGVGLGAPGVGVAPRVGVGAPGVGATPRVGVDPRFGAGGPASGAGALPGAGFGTAGKPVGRGPDNVNGGVNRAGRR